jgi:hypothetical protein
VSRIFGPVRQTAYLVRDIDSAMRHWTTTMGVGPFFLLKDHAPGGATFRGEPTDMCISLAFAQCGAVQIELIQQHNAAPSLFKEALDAGREGLHHLAFWTEHFDRDMARYREVGYQIVQAAGLGGPNNRMPSSNPARPQRSAWQSRSRRSAVRKANSSAPLRQPPTAGTAAIPSARSEAACAERCYYFFLPDASYCLR